MNDIRYLEKKMKEMKEKLKSETDYEKRRELSRQLGLMSSQICVIKRKQN